MRRGAGTPALIYSAGDARRASSTQDHHTRGKHPASKRHRARHPRGGVLRAPAWQVVQGGHPWHAAVLGMERQEGLLRPISFGRRVERQPLAGIDAQVGRQDAGATPSGGLFAGVPLGGGEVEEGRGMAADARAKRRDHTGIHLGRTLGNSRRGQVRWRLDHMRTELRRRRGHGSPPGRAVFPGLRAGRMGKPLRPDDGHKPDFDRIIGGRRRRGRTVEDQSRQYCDMQTNRGCRNQEPLARRRNPSSGQQSQGCAPSGPCDGLDGTQVHPNLAWGYSARNLRLKCGAKWVR